MSSPSVWPSSTQSGNHTSIGLVIPQIEETEKKHKNGNHKDKHLIRPTFLGDRRDFHKMVCRTLGVDARVSRGIERLISDASCMRCTNWIVVVGVGVLRCLSRFLLESDFEIAHIEKDLKCREHSCAEDDRGLRSGKLRETAPYWTCRDDAERHVRFVDKQSQWNNEIGARLCDSKGEAREMVQRIDITTNRAVGKGLVTWTRERNPAHHHAKERIGQTETRLSAVDDCVGPVGAVIGEQMDIADREREQSDKVCAGFQIPHQLSFAPHHRLVSSVPNGKSRKW